MKTFSAIVLALVCGVALAAKDDQCKNDFQSFLGCMKSAHQQRSDSDKQAAKKEKQDKANQCFADAGCDAPDWDANPMGGKGKGGGHGGMDMPPAVKECLKRKIMAKMGAKMDECLQKKHITGVNSTELMESMAGAKGEAHGQGGKDGMEAGFMAKFTAVKAVDKCSQKKGGDTNAVKPLEVCLHKIEQDQRPKMCAMIKPCEDKVSAPCKQRGEDIHKALCQCKQEKEAEIAGKLRALAQSGQKVPIQDLVKTVASDQDMSDMAQQVDSCYKENNVQEPPMVALALKFMSGGGGAKFGATMSVSSSTVTISADMLDLDANDKAACEPCPK